MMESPKSVITNRDRNCTSCRVISGCGLLGAGLYVLFHSRKCKAIGSKLFVSSLGSGNVDYFETYVTHIHIQNHYYGLIMGCNVTTTVVVTFHLIINKIQQG